MIILLVTREEQMTIGLKVLLVIRIALHLSSVRATVAQSRMISKLFRCRDGKSLLAPFGTVSGLPSNIQGYTGSIKDGFEPFSLSRRKEPSRSIRNSLGLTVEQDDANRFSSDVVNVSCLTGALFRHRVQE
jgi:hypothetical protein